MPVTAHIRYFYDFRSSRLAQLGDEEFKPYHATSVPKDTDLAANATADEPPTTAMPLKCGIKPKGHSGGGL